MNNTTFIGQEQNLVHYANKSVVDATFTIIDFEGDAIDISGNTGLIFRILDRRQGKIVREWTSGIYSDTLTYSGNVITWNAPASDMNFDLGKYYHELSYLNGDGIEIILLYGLSKFI